MAGIGDLLQQILGIGGQSPAEQVMAAAGTPAGPAADYARMGPEAAPAGAPLAAMPAPAPSPATSPASMPPPPPDLTALYSKLIQDDKRERATDRGMTMIAAAFAQPENRTALLNSMGGGHGSGSSESNAASVLTNLMTLQSKAQSAAERAKIKSQLPEIAKKYGLDTNTANMLFESGKLDDVIAQSAKRETQVVQDAGTGANWLVDKNTGARISQVTAPDPNHGKVADQKVLSDINAERAKVGKEPMGMEEYQSTSNTQKAPKTVLQVGDNKLAEGYAKTYVEDYEKARASESVIQKVQGAHNSLDQGIISGNALSPTILEGRKLLASAFNLPREAEANTETFTAQMKEVVLPRVKALGAANSITDADRKYVDEAVGATTTMTPEAAKRILLILEKGERNEIARYNKNIDKLAESNPEGAKAARRIDLPAPSKQLMGSVPAPAIDRLKSDPRPEIISQFEQKYGWGTAQMYLGGK